MEVLAYITDVTVVGKILTHLGLPLTPQPLAPARFPGQMDLQLECFDDVESSWGDKTTGWPMNRNSRGPSSRAPPELHDGEWTVELDEPFDTGDRGA